MFWWVFCLIFLAIKTKTNQRSLNSPAFFKILKESLLVKKQTIPHMKASILSFFEPEGQRHGGATPTSHKNDCYFSFWGRGDQQGWLFLILFFIMSKFRISWMYRYHFYDLKVHFWWPNKRFFWCRSSLNTLYLFNVS